MTSEGPYARRDGAPRATVNSSKTSRSVVARMLLVARCIATSRFLLLEVMHLATSSVLATSRKAPCY